MARLAGDPPSDPDTAGDVRADRELRTQRPCAAYRIDCVLLETGYLETLFSVLDDRRRITRLRTPARPLPCADSNTIGKRTEDLKATVH